MPPKKQQKPSKKTEQKKKDKIIEVFLLFVQFIIIGIFILLVRESDKALYELA